MGLSPSSPGSFTPGRGSKLGDSYVIFWFYQTDGESRVGSRKDITTPVFAGKVDGTSCGVLISWGSWQEDLMQWEKSDGNKPIVLSANQKDFMEGLVSCIPKNKWG